MSFRRGKKSDSVRDPGRLFLRSDRVVSSGAMEMLMVEILKERVEDAGEGTW